MGEGEIAPVAPEIWNFSVSSLEVVRSWLSYRMKSGAGKTSSPLDDIRPERWTADLTEELLKLLWILEATVEIFPALAENLERVIESDHFEASELPEPTAEERKPPQPDADEDDPIQPGLYDS